MRHSTCPALLAILLYTPLLSAQEVSRPVEYLPSPPDSLARRNFANILFDRNLATYNWISRLIIDTTVSATGVSLHHQYLSNIIQPELTGRKLESNQNNVALKLSTPLSNMLMVQGEWSTLVYSDNKSVGLSNASFHSLLGGIEVLPIPSFSLNPMVGYRWDNQADIRDSGPTLNLAGRTHDLELDGYWIGGTGQYHRDFLNPRTLEDHFLDLGIQKLFAPRTQDSLRLGFTRNRREFYEMADSSIESRIENIFAFANQLDYEFHPTVVANLFVSIISRGLDKDIRGQPGVPRDPGLFDTHIDEFRLDTYLQAAYRSEDGRGGAAFRIGYNERNEAHAAKLPSNVTPAIIVGFHERNRQEQTKDNISRRTSIAGQVSIPLSLSDIISVSGLASILRYDTPSDLNLEDRDEQLLALTLSTSHQMSQFLDLGITLDASLTRLVYLLKERSANNNQNRVIRLVPRITYRLSDIVTSFNAFEVLANYTVYDYEQQVALVKSFSYRQWAWIDSTGINLTQSVGLDFFAYLKLYERGQLNWDEFTERTENSYLDQTFDFQVRFTPTPATLLAVGVRYFSQARYAYDEHGKTRVAFLRSVGPTCRIAWTIGPHSLLSFKGWYEHKRFPDGAERSYPSMTMNLLLNL